jgi:inner membrane protein YidH
MIKNFRDHSANERTFLAWVRTAIAVMAFGFIVEKFDLFLEVAAPSLAGRTLSLPGQKFGNIAGLALILLGTAIVAIAAVRFLIAAKTIDSDEVHPYSGSRIDLALAVLLVLLGGALWWSPTSCRILKLPRIDNFLEAADAACKLTQDRESRRMRRSGRGTDPSNGNQELFDSRSFAPISSQV